MNIRFPLYDFFGYLLPGIVAVLAASLAVWSLYFPAVPLSLLSLPKQVWFLLVVLAYFAGHFVQAIGNLLSNWLEHPEERVFGENADSHCKALVKEAHTLIHTSLGVAHIDPMWSYRVCDAAVVHNGVSSEREIFVYREGFYRGASVSFALLTLALLVRTVMGSTTVIWNDNQFGVPRSLLVGFVIGSALTSGLMVARFHRFAQYRVKHALVSFLLIHKAKKEEANKKEATHA